MLLVVKTEMTRLRMQLLLPYSRKIVYNLTYNNCLYRVRNAVFGFSNSKLCVGQKCDQSLCIPFTCHLSKHLHSSSHQGSESDSFSEDTEEVMFPLSRISEMEDHSEHFRNTLFPISNDSIISQLKLCGSIEQLVNIVNDNLASLKSEHYCQVILVLWDMMKPNSGIPILSPGVEVVSENKELSEWLNTTKNGTAKSSPVFDLNPLLLNALEVLSNNSDELTPKALVYSILYSKRLGISLKNSFVQTLLMRISHIISENPDEFSICTLSRLTIALADNDELWARMLLIKTLPLIYKHFEKCSTSDDFRALTISMLATEPYLRRELLMEYEALIEELCRNGILSRDQTSVIVKAVVLLNTVYHKSSAREMIYKLLQMLEGNVEKLLLPHLLDIQRVVYKNLEPHFTMKEVQRLKQKYCTMQLSSQLEFSPHFLSFLILPPNTQGSRIFQEIIRDIKNIDVLLSMQHHLTTAHLDTCHIFWSKVLEIIKSTKSLESRLLPRVCLRYVNFTGRMGCYRHKEFESHMLSLITRELVEGSAVHLPNEFALLAAFVLSFDYYQRGCTSLSGDIVPRLISIIGQFDLISVLILSKGLKNGLRTNQNRRLQAFLQLDSALNERTVEIMNTGSLSATSITDFNVIMRSCINRKGSLENELLWDILKRCEELDWTQLDSRSLRNLVYNFQITSALVPAAVDHMVEYCLDSSQYISGDTIGKLAYLCYILGYTPTHGSTFCALTADLVTRDRELLNGLSLLQVALALSFFNQLSTSLHHYIFTVKFLERLDNEIKNCYAKDKYPQRVRQALMELNRSVCLDLPEADVPWFHSKFCEEQQVAGLVEKRPKSLLFTDVRSTLLSLVDDPGYISTRSYTPYGYAIDIQLNLDGASRPVPFKDPEKAIHKIALLLHYSDSYTMWERRLKGFHQMKQRHLEILGYKVIGLSDSLWNAMFMTEPKAKVEYLRNLIWPS